MRAASFHASKSKSMGALMAGVSGAGLEVPDPPSKNSSVPRCASPVLPISFRVNSTFNHICFVPFC